MKKERNELLEFLAGMAMLVWDFIFLQHMLMYQWDSSVDT